MSKFKRTIIENKFKKNIIQKKLIFRSSWEIKFANFLENNKNVKNWRNDHLFKYMDNKGVIRKYYIDFHIIMNNGDNLLIEVKPISSLKKRVKTKSFRYKIIHSTNLLKNIFKFDGVENYCRKTKNWRFYLTQYKRNTFYFYKWNIKNKIAELI